MEITEDYLLRNGFEVCKIEGKTVFVKDNQGMVENFKWIPCKIEAGRILSSGIYVDTVEQLSNLIKEGLL